MQSTPMMNFENVDIFQLKDVKSGMVQLTKWLEPTETELRYLKQEYLRISQDPERSCMIVYHECRASLFVNDMTGGMFDSLSGTDS